MSSQAVDTTLSSLKDINTNTEITKSEIITDLPAQTAVSTLKFDLTSNDHEIILTRIIKMDLKKASGDIIDYVKDFCEFYGSNNNTKPLSFSEDDLLTIAFDKLKDDATAKIENFSALVAILARNSMYSNYFTLFKLGIS